MNDRSKAISIFLAGLESVKPGNLLRRIMSVDDKILRIESLSYPLTALKNIYVVGAGKASAEMARTVENILDKRITGGHIITKYGHSVPLRFLGLTEAGHPVPDENGIKGTKQVLSIVKNAGKDDLIICLISGGGSALLTDVPEGCSLNDLKELTGILLKSGATINELNCIRKHLSKVKGGQLAKAAFPASVVSLILSDVIGDPLDVIASGPTAPDPTTFSDAVNILEKYDIKDKVPGTILHILLDGAKSGTGETLKNSDEELKRTHNFIIGNNSLSLETARAEADSLGYECRVISNTIQGDVAEVAEKIVATIKETRAGKPQHRTCLLMAGEPTVKVSGNGKGGRNQHLALLVSEKIKNTDGITFLSGGTDGSDGPTDAAGAVADSGTHTRAAELGLNAMEFIQNFDSYNYFKKEGGLIVTGPTQTNVMDLMVTIINPD